MHQEALQTFLASVRCDRFTDYLDPIGETAAEALVRRIRWAHLTKNDPAHAEEARFLIKHEDSLRNVLQMEKAQRPVDMPVERDIIAEIAELEEPSVTTGIMQFDDFEAEGTLDLDTAMPTDEFEPLEELTGEFQWEEVVGDPVEPKTLTAGGHVGLMRPRGAVRTANPAPNRTRSNPTLSAISSLASPSIPPVVPDALIEADAEATDPSARPTPELSRAIAAAAATTIPGRGKATPPPPPTDHEAALPREPDGVVVPWGAIIAVVATILLLGGVSLLVRSSDDPSSTQFTAEPAAQPVPSTHAAPTQPSAVSPTQPVDSPDVAPMKSTSGREPPSAPRATQTAPVATPTPTPEQPTAKERAPVVEPTPVPEVTKPVPEVTKPVPEVTKPVPEVTKPVPEVTKPVLEATKPVLEATKPVPEATKPVPQASQSATTDQASEQEDPVSAMLAPKWVGTLGESKLLLTLESQAGSVIAGSVVIDGGSYQRYMIYGSNKGGKLSFADAAERVKFQGRLDGAVMSGSMIRDGVSSPWTMKAEGSP